MVDGHLDLAQNALDKGRDLLLDLDDLRFMEGENPEEALVTLPELRSAGIGVVFATIFAMPRLPGRDTRRTFLDPAGARALAIDQLELYERWEKEGQIRILRTRGDLDGHVEAWGRQGDVRTGCVLLMEGAEPLITPADLDWWFGRGVRILGPAWKATRYCGGTGEPGPLTPLGAELIDGVRRLGMVLDVSHLSDDSFWQALEIGPDHVIASHSNARFIMGSDRHLPDDIIRAIGDRAGVVGLVMGNSFLNPSFSRGRPKDSVGMEDVRRHADHIAGTAGWSTIGVGSDFDGGFGRQGTPREIERAADFALLRQAVPPQHRNAFLGGNWLSLLRRVLPD